MMKNLFDLSGKVALVTGGNGGIGLGMAEGMAQHGADVVIWGTNADKNTSALERLAKQGTKVAARIVDVSDESAVKEGIATLLDDFGRLDMSVANAGVSQNHSDIFDVDMDDLDKVEGVNQRGVLYTLRESARHMIERAKAGDPGGSMVSIASTAAIHGAGRNMIYGATKGAVVSLTRAMAVEFGRHKIRVNSICPGWTRSEMTEASQNWDKFTEKVISRVPIRGWADPEQFAGIAVYLASDASTFHTGDMIVIDGAYTIY